MGLFDGGMEWLIIILVIVLILVGAKKIPEWARALGRATGEFKRGKLEVEKEIQGMSSEVKEVRDDLKEGTKAAKKVVRPTRKQAATK